MREKTLKNYYIFMLILLAGFAVFGFQRISFYEKEMPLELVSANDFSSFTEEVTLREVTYGIIPTTIGEKTFSLALAADQPRRRLGLSEVEELPEGYGMLFAFPEEGKNGFWMKQMKFPLDIIWLDAEKTVVKVLSDVSPDTFPTTFGAEVNSQYVIELNAGVVAPLGIERGDVVEFTLPFEE